MFGVLDESFRVEEEGYNSVASCIRSTSDIVESFNSIQTVGREVEVTYTTCTVTESPWDQPPSQILLAPIIECRRQFTISKTEVTVVVVDNEGLSTSPSPGYARE